jgi:pimeloyl-ACP methyl ester carboxylesterase
MRGVDDECGALRQIHAIARRVPHAVLVELPSCGHSPQRDQPERVIDEVTRFVAAHAAHTQPQHQPTA